MKNNRKRVNVILAVMMTAALLNPVPARAAGDSWGMSYQQEGQPPVGDKSAEYLAQYDAVYLGDTGRKTIYLTFDAGYENGYTAQILDALKKHEAPAAFFLVGHYVKSSPELTRRMCDEGHTVGNHTYHHPDMSKISDLEAFRKELESLDALYKETTGREMSRFYRPPQGNYSELNLSQAKQLGYKTVFWSVAYVDWQRDNQPSHETAFKKLMSRVHPGAIVLLHSTSSTNAEIMDELLTRWENEGYRFGRLEELFDMTKPPA